MAFNGMAILEAATAGLIGFTVTIAHGGMT